MPTTGASFFDASALVKVFTTEHNGDSVRNHFKNNSPTKYSTPFCIYETMNILKGKWIYKHQLTEDEYHCAVERLMAWFRPLTKYPDLDFGDPLVFKKVKEIARKYSLDWSDAFQVLSIKDGFFAPLINDSKTILVTADRRLAEVARAEGLNVWNCIDEASP